MHLFHTTMFSFSLCELEHGFFGKQYTRLYRSTMASNYCAQATFQLMKDNFDDILLHDIFSLISASFWLHRLLLSGLRDKLQRHMFEGYHSLLKKKITFILLQVLHLQLVRFTLIQSDISCCTLKCSSPFI